VKRIRRTEITVETDEILFVGHRSGIVDICPDCGEAGRLVSPQHAADLTSISAETICAWAETGAVHCSRTTDGVLLVCLKSLFGNLGSDRLLGATPSRR